MKSIKLHITLIIVLLSNIVFSQEEKMKKWELNGYITNMQSVQFEDVHGA